MELWVLKCRISIKCQYIYSKGESLIKGKLWQAAAAPTVCEWRVRIAAVACETSCTMFWSWFGIKELVSFIKSNYVILPSSTLYFSDLLGQKQTKSRKEKKRRDQQKHWKYLQSCFLYSKLVYGLGWWWVLKYKEKNSYRAKEALTSSRTEG